MGFGSALAFAAMSHFRSLGDLLDPPDGLARSCIF
jgi:hypothetical protein